MTEPFDAYLGTRDGLRRVRFADGSMEVRETAIDGHVVRDIAVDPARPADCFVGCGLRGWGLHHTTDGGSTTQAVGFRDRWVWGVTRHPRDPCTLYVGTEPPMLHVSADGGATFTALDGVDAVASRDRWTFFHEPFRAGHIHAIALHPLAPDRILAGVEHGGVLRSTDAGRTWRDTRPGTDAHRITCHPRDPSVVYLAAGDGLHVSDDGGVTWSAVEALAGRYLHTITTAPSRPDRLVAYADDDDAPVFVSDDSGSTWRPVAAGLPVARPADPVRFHPTDPDVLLYAGDVDRHTSQLYRSTDAGATWTPVGDSLPKVWRIETVPIR